MLGRADPSFPILDVGDWFQFPDPEEADGSLVAVGGNLSPGMLLSAYRQGIFPWFNDDDPILWQSPDPRFVILPERFRVGDRLARSMRRSPFRLTVDLAFARVIGFCSSIARAGQDGTWITDDMAAAYNDLHERGFAHSVEAWLGDELVGGFYGVSIGPVFFGESMFSRVPDASKTAFASFARAFFGEMGGRLIDSQVYTDHVARFGGANVSRSAYRRMLAELLPPANEGARWPADLLGRQSGGVNL
ncbi:MAG TPA: leucyl/phenylalanyl-tRNA--protein transferase [Treponemataceae bacterium]|mgnify:CR=1 FL=1|jgi:leucyl/phenylalanyl-tRNA--protein transferase|nr:leucyl/phenylalanyl-tRNA--protein transferase [Treponemataceae bacterium]